jgi:hypothetical protein
MTDIATNKVVYFMVADTCEADGHWCSALDYYHLDMSISTLAVLGKTP